MVIYMKTTLDIDDTLIERLCEEAARRGATMSALVEEGLRLVLDSGPTHAADPESHPPLPRWNSGGALVDVANRAEIYAAMGGS